MICKMEQKLKQHFEKTQFITTKALEELGYNRMQIKRLVADGVLERVARGVYMEAGELIETVALAQAVYPQGIVSHRTALYMHDLVDEIPQKIHMTFVRGTHFGNQKKLKEYIIPHYQERRLFEIGVETKTSLWGNPIRVYSPERALIDVWRIQEDPAVQIEALHEYFNSNDYNLGRLSLMMADFSKTKKLANALAVLIN